VVRGGCLGEMALIGPAPRSATAVAGQDCTRVGTDERTFHELVRQVPGSALGVLRVMVRRLRQSAP
jgi:CRP-like cAMP-binding protein